MSKHLAVLKQARVVSNERVGRERRYIVRTDTLAQARQYLERASQQWDEAAERLRRIVEE